MDKQLIERIALELLDSFIGKPTDPNKTDREEFAAYAVEFLERIDAERGKEAVAWRFVDDEDGGHVSFQKSPPTKEQIEYLARWNRPKWEPLFLSAPTIPPSKEPGDHYACGWNACRDAMIAAAQGERNAD